jgi:hypothetical protein
MRLAKKLLVAVCASLLFVTTVGSARHAYAQDAYESDQSMGAWSAPDAGGAIPDGKTKVPPLDIKGCWSGQVADTADGTGTATFQFDQNSNLKKLIIGSTFNFQWADSAFARGPINGSVSSSGFKFKGNAGGACKVSGSGTGDATALMGTFQFVGTCGSLFQGVTFSITPGCP